MSKDHIAISGILIAIFGGLFIVAPLTNVLAPIFGIQIHAPFKSPGILVLSAVIYILLGLLGQLGLRVKEGDLERAKKFLYYWLSFGIPATLITWIFYKPPYLGF